MGICKRNEPREKNQHENDDFVKFLSYFERFQFTLRVIYSIIVHGDERVI